MPKRKTRVIAITGSPSPHNLVAPAKRIKRPNFRKDYLRGESQDPEYLYEAAMDLKYGADTDMAMMMRGVPLADFECPHGHLPHDPGLDCDCWRSRRRPITALLDDLRRSREALYKLVSRDAQRPGGKRAA